MAEYQKFMFDNFVIDCGQKDRADEEAAVVEDVEVCPEPEIEEIEAVAEEPAVAEAEEKTLIAEAELPPPPPSFSQEELNAAVAKAREEGYEKGFQAALGDYEKQEAEMLQSLNNRLLSMLVDTEAFQKQLEQDNLGFVSGVLKKVFPTLAAKQAAAELELFLEENFSHFKNEPSLSFSFNPDSVKIAAALLPKLANANDFEGKISVHKDEALGVGDCRIEWKNGGVERNADKMLEKVSNLLEDKTIETKERENGK